MLPRTDPGRISLVQAGTILVHFFGTIQAYDYWAMEETAWLYWFSNKQVKQPAIGIINAKILLSG
jgi:hypothetical protein